MQLLHRIREAGVELANPEALLAQLRGLLRDESKSAY